ncbi:MAG: Gfo/Idh/MocA family protein [Pirellulaceae bacterium]
MTRYNRRQFLSSAGAVGASFLILGQSGSVRGYQACEKLNLAIIGAGGRGADNLAGVSSENIVALCDVDERRAAASFAKFPTAARYRDYRQMLGDLDRRIDAVVVSTTNHVHVPASVMAMRMGKHCYCEKPLAHSVGEARLAARVAAEHHVATQMGTQIHASENYRRIVELIRGGAIGVVDQCHCWLPGGGSAGDRPQETPPVPAGLDWDLWLGPAPTRPYHPCYVPHDWHYWWDFGGGAFGNMGCHYLDLAFWALELRHPVTVEASGPPPHQESTPAWQHVRYEFPARGDSPPLMLTWTHGETAPAVFRENQLPEWVWGVFVGSRGMLLANYDRCMLWPEAAFADFVAPEPSIPASIGHHQEWIAACKTGSPTTCNFEYSGALTETVLLGNAAYRAGQKLTWDAEHLTFPNAPEAQGFLQREYRPGW